MAVDFIASYIDYNKDTEPPYVYHRFVAIALLSAMLGRKCWYPFGHFRIFPNLYMMLMGEPGARKSTAIKIGKKLLSEAGYDSFAADKTTKEQFLFDLAGYIKEDELESMAARVKKATRKYDTTMSANLWGDDIDAIDKEPKETFICADEFNEFAGSGNLEFYTTLGNLWDWDDEDKPFSQRFKNSRSVSIYQPTITLLGGNTQENFARAFPPEIMGQGFLSRMLLIHGEKSGRRYTEPSTPEKLKRDLLVSHLQRVRSSFPSGAITRNEAAFTILDKIYRGWTDLHDVRFKSYSTRRFTQLIKLCVLTAVAQEHSVITDRTVVEANTMLCYIEHFMGTAIGEFGKAKNSDITNKVMQVLGSATKPVNIRELWKHVNKDLEKFLQLGELMQGLLQAEKVQFVKGSGEGGYLLKKIAAKKLEYVDWGILTEEERSGVS